jgi:ribonuclease BN (tRNA processing enzyme)
MRIVLLGTGGFHPNERRHTACVMLPESGVIFDAGTAFFRVAERLQTDSVQIFLTHAHLDHIAGLTFFLVPLLRGTVKRARLYGSARTLDAVRQHLFAKPVFPILPSFEFIELDQSEAVEVPGGVLTHRPLPSHPAGSTAFRMDWPIRDGAPPKSLAYITDTSVDGSYTEFVRGVDLLIHECYFPDDKAVWANQTGHSHTTPVAELARAAGVGRLVLVHVDPLSPLEDPVDVAAARRIFPDTELGRDLDEFKV